MNQTKLESSLEATANIATGFVISYLVWIGPIVWMFGHDLDPHDHLQAFLITCTFTVTSWCRSYVWRRFFNRRLHARIHRFLARAA